MLVLKTQQMSATNITSLINQDFREEILFKELNETMEVSRGFKCRNEKSSNKNITGENMVSEMKTSLKSLTSRITDA